MAGLLFAYARQDRGPDAPRPQTSLTTPPAPGFAPQSQTPRNQTQAADLAHLFEALFGRVATKLGPTNPRWATFYGDLSPELITQAIDQANMGMPYTFWDMSRRAVENDAHLGGAIELAFSGIVAKDDRIEPPRTMRRDKLAISVGNWLRAVREQIADFNPARYGLLWAEGTGYACAEAIYAYRPLTWFTADNERVTATYCVPVKLELVDGRAIRFDTETDEPLLWLSDPGDYVTLPPAKFIFHRAYGITSLAERRGFMRSVLYLHALKQACIRDMGVYAHLYGIPQMIAEFNAAKHKPEEAKQITEEVLRYFGQGGIPTVPMQTFNLRTDTPAPNGALVHSQAAEFLNQEMTKRVGATGPLMMESGGGNYGLGDVHAEGAFAAQLLRAGNLCGTIRRDLWAPCLAINVLRLALDLAEPPAEIMCALPDYHARLLREDTPEKRQAVFSQAMKDGMPISRTQYRAELHLDEPRDQEDQLKGEAVSVPSSGATASSVDASEGEIASLIEGSAKTVTPTTPPLGAKPELQETA